MIIFGKISFYDSRHKPNASAAAECEVNLLVALFTVVGSVRECPCCLSPRSQLTNSPRLPLQLVSSPPLHLLLRCLLLFLALFLRKIYSIRASVKFNLIQRQICLGLREANRAVYLSAASNLLSPVSLGSLICEEYINYTQSSIE